MKIPYTSDLYNLLVKKSSEEIDKNLTNKLVNSFTFKNIGEVTQSLQSDLFQNKFVHKNFTDIDNKRTRKYLEIDKVLNFVCSIYLFILYEILIFFRLLNITIFGKKVGHLKIKNFVYLVFINIVIGVCSRNRLSVGVE